MTIVDSSVLIAFLYPEDTQHEKAQKALASLPGFATTEYILLEVLTVLRFKGEDRLGSLLIDHALSNTGITLLNSTPQAFIATTKLFQTANFPKLSFVDTHLLALSKKYNVLTFDKALTRAIKKYSK